MHARSASHSCGHDRGTRLKTVILAGGLGRRLRTVVGNQAKPMADIYGKPFLQYLLERLRAQAFTDLVICVGYRAHEIQAYFGTGRGYGVQVAYAVERELLGTAGALANARGFLDSTFLVLNGDSYLEADFAAMVECHAHHRMDNSDAIGTVASVWMHDARRYGALAVDECGRILEFNEKHASGPAWINAGVYVLEPAILDAIPRDVSVSIERETFPTVLASGKQLFAYRAAGLVLDIGTAGGYSSFQRFIDIHNRCTGELVADP